MQSLRKKSPSQVLKKGYSDEEVQHIYELGRLSLENGNLRRAETIFKGLTEVAPEYWQGWLAMAVMQAQSSKLEEAADSARRALVIEPEAAEAMILLASIYLTLGDYNLAGTHLGEIGDLIESGLTTNPHIIRLYRLQLTRYESR
jgi:Flp pilus assembly protein TadD